MLVEDLRALALTDTGSLALNREPVDPAELVDETVATFAAQAGEARVKLIPSAPSGLPVVDVDPARMRSAIGNVIANAIRHTPSGGSVSVSAVAADARLVIPIRPGLRSLNVAMAAAMALGEALRQTGSAIRADAVEEKQ